MDSYNNYRISSKVKTTNFKALIMGILLIATIFLLVDSNISGNAFAQDGNNNIIGCTHTVKVTISHLPQQTSDASTEITLSNIGPNDDQGSGSISIPGIGSGHVKVGFHIATISDYGATVSDIPGQTEVSSPSNLSEAAVCNSESPQSVFLFIPGIGSGSLSMIKVN